MLRARSRRARPCSQSRRYAMTMPHLRPTVPCTRVAPRRQLLHPPCATSPKAEPSTTASAPLHSRHAASPPMYRATLRRGHTGICAAVPTPVVPTRRRAPRDAVSAPRHAQCAGPSRRTTATASVDARRVLPHLRPCRVPRPCLRLGANRRHREGKP